MKILLLADIHANWPALSAVHQAEPDFDECFVLGDLVDFGVGARAVLNWVRQHATVVIRGNHDHAVGQGIVPHPASTPFKQLRNETRRHHWYTLNASELNQLRSFPIQLSIHREGLRMQLLHATPHDPLYEMLPIDSPLWAQRLAEVTAEFVCVGHTHVPGMLEWNGQKLVNPGSVGQPRDGIPLASYVIVTNGLVEFKRIDYDISESVQSLRDAGISTQAVAAAQVVLQTGIVPAG